MTTHIQYAALDDSRITRLDGDEIDASVARILMLKRAKNILAGQVAPAEMGETERRLAKEVESSIADQSITLLQNHQLLPLRDSRKIVIFTPWGEQGHAVRQVLEQKGFHDIGSHKLADIAWQAQQREIDRSDIVIVSNQAVGVNPEENNGQASGAAGTTRRTLPPLSIVPAASKRKSCCC